VSRLIIDFTDSSDQFLEQLRLRHAEVTGRNADNGELVSCGLKLLGWYLTDVVGKGSLKLALNGEREIYTVELEL